MASDDKFAQWASLFVNAQAAGAADAGSTGKPAGAGGVQYAGVTQAASELLQAVDAGGVPAFVTSKLKQIAEDNGVEVADDWTPNEIVAALRGKAQNSAAAKATPGD